MSEACLIGHGITDSLSDRPRDLAAIPSAHDGTAAASHNRPSIDLLVGDLRLAQGRRVAEKRASCRAFCSSSAPSGIGRFVRDACRSRSFAAKCVQGRATRRGGTVASAERGLDGGARGRPERTMPRPAQGAGRGIYAGNRVCVIVDGATTRCFPARLVGRRYSRSVKEVIQPQVPLRLPCYDFAPVTALAFGRLAPCGFRHGLRALTASMA